MVAQTVKKKARQEDMAKRVRIIIDTDEQTRLAIRLAATKRNIGLSELVNQVLRETFSQEMKEAKKWVPDDKEGEQ